MWWIPSSALAFTPVPDQVIAPPPAASWVGAWAGDLDGDGDDDLVVRDAARAPIYAYALLRGGPGGLPSVPVPLPGSGSEIAILDVDGDGDDDWAEIDLGAGTMTLWPGGSTVPVAPASVTVVNVAAVGGVGDFDGDGREDLAITDTSAPGVGAAHTEVYYGNAAGALPPVPDLELADNPHSLAVTDVDGDGYDDLVKVSTRQVQVLAGGPARLGTVATWSRPTGIQSVLQWARGGGDLDGDGYEDLLVSGSWDVHLYRGGPNGLGAPWLVPFNRGNEAEVAFVRDVDGDGDDELVMGAATLGANPAQRGEAALLAGGTGTVLGEVHGDRPLAWVGEVVVAGDFDGNGVVDWGAQESDGALAIDYVP